MQLLSPTTITTAITLAEGQPVPARVALESFLQREPTHAEAHLILANIAWKDYRLRDATHHAKSAARNMPRALTMACAIMRAWPSLQSV